MCFAHYKAVNVGSLFAYTHLELLLTPPRGPGASQPAGGIPARIPSSAWKRSPWQGCEREPGKSARRGRAGRRGHAALHPLHPTAPHRTGAKAASHGREASHGFLPQAQASRSVGDLGQCILRSLKISWRQKQQVESWKVAEAIGNLKTVGPEGPIWGSIDSVTISRKQLFIKKLSTIPGTFSQILMQTNSLEEGPSLYRRS